MLGGGGQTEVVDAVDIFHLYQAQDVLHADGPFHVGLAAVHHEAVVGEHHQPLAVAVLRQEGVVLFGERAPEGFELDDFAHLHPPEQGDAVEQLAAHLPGELQRGVAVVEELHVVDHVEQHGRDDVREVGLRHG